jgi:methionyl-tRNA synthetase
MKKKYYLTTPLYYVNSRPHIGHSYTNIAADTLARFKRLELGRENVFFLTGTDEHGQKIDKASQAAGMTPQDFTDKISETFKSLWRVLGIEYDDFIRTTEDRHKDTVRRVWTALSEKNEIYKDVYSGFYCTPDETFWGPAQVLNENGQALCPDCKRPVEPLKEENYFLKISKYQGWLMDQIKTDQMLILPQTRKNEVLGFLEHNTLQDLCISRPKNRLAWGIASPLSDAHVTYVWFDALINYISACGWGVDQKKFDHWWPADAHLIGKDILRHHAVYWPIILHALGIEPPKMIFAHGWWVQGGEKMSKSRGNVVDPVEIVKTYGVDPYRYFLLNEAAFGSDGTFSEEALIERYNGSLANDLGNLLHRSLTMCEKYFEGKAPAGISLKCQNLLRQEADALFDKLCPLMDRLAFSEALSLIWNLISRANKFIEEKAPWKLAKEGKTDELKVVIVSLLEVLRMVAAAAWSFVPKTGEGLWKQLGIEESLEKVSIKEIKWGYFEKGGVIAKGAPLFPKIEISRES